jgi:quinol monooxygenase YgiN
VTDDGTLVMLARFESEEAAQQNSDRPEQTAWWEQMATLFTGEPEFHNSTSVDVETPGDPSQAGFVQVMQGRSSDPDRARELMDNDPTDWQEFRPEILGTVSVNHDDNAWTMAMYFTSEEAAREGEQKEPPPEMQATMKELESLSVGEPVYFDLRDPWLHAPG